MSERGQVRTRVLEVKGKSGFHLRPVSMLVQVASKYDSEITVRKDNISVGAGSVMELLLLGAQQGDRLEVTACGADSAEALDAIERLFRDLRDE